MFIVEVIPFKKGVSIESLSYYSATSYPVGTILDIPIQKHTVSGVVTSTKPVSAARAALRTATFHLKKLPPQTKKATLPANVRATAEYLSGHIPAHIGSILFALLPVDIRSGIRKYPKTSDMQIGEVTPPSLLTNLKSDRYISYRSHIRQTFAHRGSVLFVVPTAVAVAEAASLLKTGIEKRVITFSSSHTKRQLDASYEAFEDFSQAKLIITTPSYAFLDRHDIATIIVDQSGNNNYIARTRPYLDIREALKIYARISRRLLILGDILPQTEDEYKRREDIYTTYEEHTKRISLSASLQILPHSKNKNGTYTFSILTKALEEAISRTLANKGNIFLHTAHRGMAPLVVCGDCGHIFRCPDSGAPYSLLRTGKGENEKRWFYSATSGKRVRANDTCPDCGSWKLREQGIGIQKVYEVVQEIYPQADIFLFDHSTANTHTKAKKIMTAFYSSKQGILIGTNMALQYLQKNVTLSAVISYEALRAIPTWRADESVLSLLLSLREITKTDVLVQTRCESDDMLTYAKKGLLDTFYTEEIAVREALLYPPFATFILLSWMGTSEQITQLQENIEKTLPQTDMTFYSAPYGSDSKIIRRGLIRVSNDMPSSEIIDTLRNLPPYIKIEVNPDRII